MNEVKIFDGILSLDDSNDIIGKNKHKYAKNGVFKGNAPMMHFTSIKGNQKINVSLPSNDCRIFGSIVYIPQCNLAGTATYIPVCTLEGGATLIANGNPQWTNQNYTTCYNCVMTTVYRDTNQYSATYQHYQVGGNDVGLTAPSSAACNTTPIWVNDGDKTICSGPGNYDLHHMTIDTNPCSPYYGVSGIGSLIQEHSSQCGWSEATISGVITMSPDGGDLCVVGSTGDIGVITITFQGPSNCAAQALIYMPNLAWDYVGEDGVFYVRQKTGGTYYIRKYNRAGLQNIAYPDGQCWDCPA